MTENEPEQSAVSQTKYELVVPKALLWFILLTLWIIIGLAVWVYLL